MLHVLKNASRKILLFNGLEALGFKFFEMFGYH